MQLTDRLFALRRTPPFDRLRSSELALIAECTRARRFVTGDDLGLAGRPMTRLQVVVEGGFENDQGEDAPQILGLASLLYDQPLESPWRACADGAETLEIRRGHLFTILRECPELALGFLEGEELRLVDPHEVLR